MSAPELFRQMLNFRCGFSSLVNRFVVVILATYNNKASDWVASGGLGAWLILTVGTLCERSACLLYHNGKWVAAFSADSIVRQ